MRAKLLCKISSRDPVDDEMKQWTVNEACICRQLNVMRWKLFIFQQEICLFRSDDTRRKISNRNHSWWLINRDGKRVSISRVTCELWSCVENSAQSTVICRSRYGRELIGHRAQWERPAEFLRGNHLSGSHRTASSNYFRLIESLAGLLPA